MKIKSIVLTLSLSVLSLSAFASQNQVKLVAGDLNPETSLCLIAAESGVKAARRAASKMDQKIEFVEYTTYCNGVTLKKFAKQYQTASVK